MNSKLGSASCCARPLTTARTECSPCLTKAGGALLRLAAAAASLLALGVLSERPAWSDPDDRCFGIRAVDDRTGRGIPLVELETVHHLRYVTDSAGWAAFHEPGLMRQKIFFHVRSHGYEAPKDGFGFAGVALETAPGGRAEIRMRRLNLAERLYRITGEGIYSDSVRLGEPAPLAQPLGAGRVAGQDSTFAVLHRGRIHWYWGDTSRLSYPLGHFWMAGATSKLPGQGGLDPAVGIDLDYFVSADGFSRPLARMGVERGLMWLDGFLVTPDGTGRDRIVAHYDHVESLGKSFGHGMAIYMDDKAEFARMHALDTTNRWRFPRGHVIRHREGGADYFYCGEVFLDVRVRADFASVTNPAAYEAWTCLETGSAPASARVRRGADGALSWRWSRHSDPVDPGREQQLVDAGQIAASEAWLNPADIESGQRIRVHRGSVNWNDYRKCWILIATQQGGSSALGEVWYAEAPGPTGPWRRARKIVTHDRYTFYNPVHHPFFDQEGGRIIYFEGTYANTFSGNPDATPRYDYNQIMYRLDLSDARLRSRASAAGK
ncbi:MAG TPA: hypothetical protein P5555_13470 [Candidatus Paceibacterota bacterium]|nr:hypothetical protein [Verrucomicrobiota bacterium]HRZ46193.1 hypothetical protein [Candidatus Paceibacterota bacterium]HRZ92710.1 hypothetical protein [Candidatus Paceibacterota bacterium]